MKLRALSGRDVRRCLDIKTVMAATETVYTRGAEGKALVWPTVFHDFETGRKDMDIKSGCIMGGEGIHGLKTINWTLANAERGLPELVGLVIVFDTDTGLPLGLLDAGFITGLRTGCSAAVGAKYLARKNSRTMLLLGTGALSPFLTGALVWQFPRMERVYIANTVHPDKGVSCARGICERLRNELNIDAGGVDFRPVIGENELKTAVGESDIIVTATPSRTPIIRKGWVRPGTHFSCIGADMPGKEELDPALLSDAVIFCDDKKNCIEAGEIEVPIKSGALSPDGVRGEIGELILGKLGSRGSDGDITVFDAAGTALLDLAAARAALETAEEKQLGQVFEL